MELMTDETTDHARSITTTKIYREDAEYIQSLRFGFKYGKTSAEIIHYMVLKQKEETESGVLMSALPMIELELYDDDIATRQRKIRQLLQVLENILDDNDNKLNKTTGKHSETTIQEEKQ